MSMHSTNTWRPESTQSSNSLSTRSRESAQSLEPRKTLRLAFSESHVRETLSLEVGESLRSPETRSLEYARVPDP